MVGQVGKKKDIRKALKAYIMRDREKQRLEDEAEAEKCRKKKEQDEKKVKEENEFKATKDKITELTKKHEQLQQDKIRVFDHLKKLLSENTKPLGVDDLARLYDIGLAVTCVTTNHQPVYPVNSVPSTSSGTPRTISILGNQYKTSATTAVTLPVQSLPQQQKRNRSPSPPVYRSYYKQAAGPIAFQKLEDHRNHEYNRSYLYPKPGGAPQSSTFSAFYSPSQSSGSYTIPSPSVHSNTSVYTPYNANREPVEVIHKSQPPIGPPPMSNATPSPHSSLFGSHRSIQPGPSSSIQQANHVPYLVDHQKNNQAYAEDKYYMVRPTLGTHVPIHAGVIPIQQPPQGAKHGNITSGYPVRPIATSIAPQVQLHIQGHGGHHSQQPHHPSLSSHHPSSQQPPHVSQSIAHQPHHQSSVHYQPHHSQSQSAQQPHSSQSNMSHPSQSHHPQHLQHQLHGHHPPPHSQASSHHQLIQHHSSPTIHHSSSQQHLSQSLHHQQALSQHHQSHSQQLHHQQIQQPHIQQHISSHQPQNQQSQPTSVVTSQAYANQMNAISGGNRVVYSQQSVPH